MRGHIRRENLIQNLSSYFGIEIQQDISLPDLHRQIKDLLKKYIYWGAWWGLNAGKWLGTWYMKQAANHFFKHNVTWTGCFSNLGQLHVRKKTPGPHDDSEVWFGCPPVTRYQPIGATSIIWNEQLVMALRIHPCLTEDFSVVQNSLDTWVSSLRALAGIA